MTFTEALTILKGKQETHWQPFRVVLACGFTPLHLQTFLGAYLRQNLPQHRIEITTGLYGDLAGTLSKWDDPNLQAAAVIIEWPDLDPRLGYRSLGGWGLKDVADIESNIRQSLGRLRASFDRAPRQCRMALCLPTLPLPPLFHTTGWQASDAEARLQAAVYEFAAWAASHENVRLVNSQRLAQVSSPGESLDFKTDLLAGLPYTLKHAGQVAYFLANLIQPPPPKKGLITDLDDTLWKGIVGEVGAGNVSWDLASHSQLHGIYQQLLSSLAGQGVLIAVASKNDPPAVDHAFARQDILLNRDSIFPLEVHWMEKSGSVTRILEQWNIGADSVVFIDDSPMELAEVHAVHPDVECLLFPKNDYAAAYRLFRDLRDRFGKPQVREEDTLRLASLRQTAVLQQSAGGASETTEALLAAAGAVLTIDIAPSPEDGRVLELVNKTNQFNLNGVRYTEVDWHNQRSTPGAIVVAVSYRDKFGPLGKIAVVKARQTGVCLIVDTWVMSCRAFSRRIEYQILQILFDRLGVRQISFEFIPTSKNGPIRAYFSSLLGVEPEAPFQMSHEAFKAKCPPLYHQIEYRRD